MLYIKTPALLLIFCAGLLFLAATNRPAVTLSGHLPSKAGQLLVLSNKSHFSLQIPAGHAGRFKSRFPADSGYYDLNGITVYLEPGMKLFMDTTEKGYHFEGKGAAENNLLQELHSLLMHYWPVADGQLSEKATFMEPGEFIQKMNDYRAEALNILAGQPPGNYFLRTQKKEIDYTVRYYTWLYMCSYGIDRKKQSEYDEHYDKLIIAGKVDSAARVDQMRYFRDSIQVKKIPAVELLRLDSMTWKNFDLNDEDLYKCSVEYRELLDQDFGRFVFLKPAKYLPRFQQSLNQYKSNINVINGEITDSYIREALLYRFTKLLLQTGSKDLEQYYADYIHQSTDSLDAVEIKTIYSNLKTYTAGAMAPEFAYNDVSGIPHSLSSLRGHYVYIDVWATWCVPCKNELPFLKTMEEQYEGKNIRFVGISVDKAANRDLWKDFVQKNDLGGLQVMADHDFSSDFMHRFNIVSIPRFILIDPEEKIVSENADRPSNPALTALLDRLLR